MSTSIIVLIIINCIIQIYIGYIVSKIYFAKHSGLVKTTVQENVDLKSRVQENQRYIKTLEDKNRKLSNIIEDIDNTLDNYK